jgi:hypothetical protein
LDKGLKQIKKTFTRIGKGLANNSHVANKAGDTGLGMTTLLYSYSPLENLLLSL